MRFQSTLMAMIACALCACGDGDNDDSRARAPGGVKSATTRTLESGADFLQEKPPMAAINAYLNGFHFYNGRQNEQMEAHHFCSILNDEFIQCVIYDGNRADSKLIGLEYIISERLFNELPEEEKAFWHSHVYEVKSGQLVAPGIPPFAEHQLMGKLVRTYGKTWHTWHTDHKALPLGVPQLMMGFTADGQVDPALVGERNKRLHIDGARKRQDRANIAAPAVAPGADAWLEGNAVQLVDPTGAERTPHSEKRSGPATRPPPMK